jgi:branched-chain amino acid transport system substrate-binding protein
MFALSAAGFAQSCDLKIDGKTCKVSVVSCDSKYTPDGAAAGANALAGEGVHIVIGPVGSVEIAAVKPVAARNGELTGNAAYPNNAEEPEYPLTFQVSPPPAIWADPIVKRALKTFPIKSVVLVVPNDLTGTDVSGVDSKAYEANGVKASTEFHQRGTTNFAPIGRVGGPGTAEIPRVCGGLEVLKDFYWYEAVPTDDPRVQAMDEEFRKLVGRDPVGGTTFWSYLPGARMTMTTIQAAGTDDAGKVAAVPRKMPLEDPNIGKGHWTGKTCYGIQQTLFFPFGVGIIKDGKNLGVERQEVQAED